MFVRLFKWHLGVSSLHNKWINRGARRMNNDDKMELLQYVSVYGIIEIYRVNIQVYQWHKSLSRLNNEKKWIKNYKMNILLQLVFHIEFLKFWFYIQMMKEWEWWDCCWTVIEPEPFYELSWKFFCTRRSYTLKCTVPIKTLTSTCSVSIFHIWQFNSS